MPHINITLYEGRSLAQQEEICLKIHQVLGESLGFAPEALSVSLTETPPEDFVPTVEQGLETGTLWVPSKVIQKK